MDFLSERARGIAPYTAGEQPQGRTYIKLNTNENPYPPSPAVAARLRAFEDEALRRYPSPDAEGLRRAIAAAEEVKPEQVFCGNGSDEVLFLAFAAFFDGARRACFPDITYSFYEVYARFFGVPARIVPLRPDFTMDLQAMAAEPCEGYFLANPNAPTGIGIPRGEFEAFVAAARGKLVVADEAYMDFYGQSCVPLVGRYENLLVVRTFSKSYSLAGIRCGYAIGSEALISGLRRMKDCMNSYPVDRVCEAVCTSALQDRAYHERTVALVVSERERLRGELLSLGFTVPESGANFLFAGRAARSGQELYTKLKERGVLVRFWDRPVLRDFCRITVGTKEENDCLLGHIRAILAE